MNNVNMTTLKDCFKPMLSNTPIHSFFQLALSPDTRYPNISVILQNHDYEALDSLYFYGRSGRKIISPLLEMNLNYEIFERSTAFQGYRIFLYD